MAKIKNKRLHEKRYVENKILTFAFTHDKREKHNSFFDWANSLNIKSNPIHDAKLMLENRLKK